MSLLSQLFEGKITFGQAVSEGQQWFSNILSHAPAAVQADVSDALSNFKQAASNAVALADTSLGPILAIGTAAVETAANTALTAATGGIAAPLTPIVDSGIQSVVNALHAEIDAVAAQVRAKLATPTPAPTTAQTTS